MNDLENTPESKAALIADLRKEIDNLKYLQKRDHEDIVKLKAKLSQAETTIEMFIDKLT